MPVKYLRATRTRAGFRPGTGACCSCCSRPGSVAYFSRIRDPTAVLTLQCNFRVNFELGSCQAVTVTGVTFTEVAFKLLVPLPGSCQWRGLCTGSAESKVAYSASGTLRGADAAFAWDLASGRRGQGPKTAAVPVQQCICAQAGTGSGQPTRAARAGPAPGPGPCSGPS